MLDIRVKIILERWKKFYAVEQIPAPQLHDTQNNSASNSTCVLCEKLETQLNQAKSSFSYYQSEVVRQTNENLGLANAVRQKGTILKFWMGFNNC